MVVRRSARRKRPRRRHRTKVPRGRAIGSGRQAAWKRLRTYHLATPRPRGVAAGGLGRRTVRGRAKVRRGGAGERRRQGDRLASHRGCRRPAAGRPRKARAGLRLHHRRRAEAGRRCAARAQAAAAATQLLTGWRSSTQRQPRTPRWRQRWAEVTRYRLARQRQGGVRVEGRWQRRVQGRVGRAEPGEGAAGYR